MIPCWLSPHNNLPHQHAKQLITSTHSVRTTQQIHVSTTLSLQIINTDPETHFPTIHTIFLQDHSLRVTALHINILKEYNNNNWRTRIRQITIVNAAHLTTTPKSEPNKYLITSNINNTTTTVSAKNNCFVIISAPHTEKTEHYNRNIPFNLSARNNPYRTYI
jgi:hypothetical protein